MKAKLTPIQTAHAEIIHLRFKEFTTWPEKLSALTKWWSDQFNGKRDLLKILNHLAEQKVIRFAVPERRSQDYCTSSDLDVFLNDTEKS
jgi:hypothetical protein